VVREGEKEGGVEAIDAEERARNETLEERNWESKRGKRKAFEALLKLIVIIMMSERKSLDLSFSFKIENEY